MRGHRVTVGELAGGLEHHVDSETLPRQPRRVLLAQDLDRLVAGADLAVGAEARRLPGPMDRIVLEEMRQRPGVGDVVHRHELQRSVALDRGAYHQSADAAEPVDSN